ncbi:MAG: FecR domain-containing protein [Pseudobacter sp.]|uniref:FecR domain-containing protein n=1 Tax=Pseudobacter sp. TaxID=2045420 RepID=UPI003F80BF8A
MDQPNQSGFFNRFIEGSFTESEHDEFVKWVQQADRAELERAWDLFSGIEAGNEDHETPPASFREALERRLDQVERPARISRTWWYAAASVLAVAGISVYFLINRQPESNTIPPIAKVESTTADNNSNKAILTLSNGRQISLDDIPPGQLAQENGVIIQKDSNGQLQYSISNKDQANDANTFNTISTPRGRQYQVNLPDGSTVWLNAASSLHFPVNFTGPQRKVVVTGEAFFAVKQNKDQPFIVQSGQQELEVLGTSFNLNAYAADITTSLVDGSVKVINTYSKEQVLLKPGRQTITGQGEIAVTGFDPDIVLGWRNGLFTYNKAPLTAVMADFERWYDVEVEYAGKVPDFDFKGQIPRKFTIGQFLDVMSNYPVHFKMETVNNRQKLVVSAP